MNMITNFGKEIIDRIMGGRGEASITVPVLDGALQPNDIIDRATQIAKLDKIDNIVVSGSDLFASSGNTIWRLEDEKFTIHSTHEAEISCLAAGPDGIMAIGMDNLGVKIIGESFDEKIFHENKNIKLNCPTAMVFDPENDGVLFIANGSSDFPSSKWQHDLLNWGKSGTVVRINFKEGSIREIARGLKYPSGICFSPMHSDSLIVSEAWAHRLISIPKDGAGPFKSVLAELPAYPARIFSSSSGGYWLSVFSVRSQLQEFVLREHKFRHLMMTEISPEYWIAPALTSGNSFKEPLQAGGVIRLGVHKPWAPTRSYGLIIKLDESSIPVGSAHCRAGGRRHGITSILEQKNDILFTSKGNNELLSLSIKDFMINSENQLNGDGE